MPVPFAKSCVTCSKPCYPTEKMMISDLWIHKQGCLKCSVCFTTLSLSSVYVATSPLISGDRQLYCAKDVPKVVHTSIVDSLALRAAMNAPNPTTTPVGVFAPKGKGGSTRSIRFKGLTLRSRSIKAGLDAPKLNLRGLMRSQTIVGSAPGSPLDSWDIIHAMNVQSQVSSPIRDHPAIHAQRTGPASYAPRPSQPLFPDQTGEEAAKAGKDEEPISIQPELVKNLIRVFQLETIEKVEVESIPTEPLDAYDQSSAGIGSIKCPTLAAQGTIRTIATLASRAGTSFGTSATVGKPSGRLPLSEIFANHAPVTVTPTTPAKPTKPMRRDSTVERQQSRAGGEMDSRKAMTLLNALLPLAAHLIPLPADDETWEEEATEVMEAREALAAGLERQDLELVMVFEEEPQKITSSEHYLG